MKQKRIEPKKKYKNKKIKMYNNVCQHFIKKCLQFAENY